MCGWVQRDPLVPHHVILDIEVEFGLRHTVDFGEIDLIAESGLASLLQRHLALSGNDLHFLISV